MRRFCTPRSATCNGALVTFGTEVPEDVPNKARWRSALVVVKPETVIAWHREGFRLFWTWKIRQGQVGRPAVPREVRDLIRKMRRENPLYVEHELMLS
jgi:hypothetical protein